MELTEAKERAVEDGTVRVTKFRGTLKSVIRGVALLVAIGFVTVWLTQLSHWATAPASVVTTPAVKQQHVVTQQPAANHCLGAGESKAIGEQWVAINPDFRCHIIFEVASGTVLLGEPNNFVEVSPGDRVGNVLRSKGVRVIYAKAKSGTIRLNYMLHRHGCVEDGWTCR
jgi:hypothetical protein